MVKSLYVNVWSNFPYFQSQNINLDCIIDHPPGIQTSLLTDCPPFCAYTGLEEIHKIRKTLCNIMLIPIIYCDLTLWTVYVIGIIMIWHTVIPMFADNWKRHYAIVWKWQWSESFEVPEWFTSSKLSILSHVSGKLHDALQILLFENVNGVSLFQWFQCI